MLRSVPALDAPLLQGHRATLQALGHTLPTPGLLGPSSVRAQTLPADPGLTWDSRLTPTKSTEQLSGPRPSPTCTTLPRVPALGQLPVPTAPSQAPHYIWQPQPAKPLGTWHHQSQADWVPGIVGLPPGGRSRHGGRSPTGGGCRHPAGSGLDPGG